MNCCWPKTNSNFVVELVSLEEVEQSNKDKMNEIFKKIEEELGKLKLSDEFSTPMMVLVEPKTSLKLVKPYAIPNEFSSSNVYSSTYSW